MGCTEGAQNCQDSPAKARTSCYLLKWLERIPFAVDSGQGGLLKRLLTFYTKGGSPGITLSVIEWAREASPAGAKRPPAATGRAVALELHRTHAKICT